MDLEIAEPAANAAIGRRNLIGMAGVAGLAGAAAAMLSAQTTLASSEQANQPTDADTALLASALGLELTARDLYRSQLEARPSSDLAAAIGVMAENHEAYAQAIAGATGLSASNDARNEELFEEFATGFAGNDFAAAAHDLEQWAVRTHTSFLGEYESADAITLTTSILVTEARHATVLAAVLGVDDLDTLFSTDQSATGGDA